MQEYTVCIESTVHSEQFCDITVEMLQKLKQASEAGETVSEVPVCSESHSLNDATDVNEPDKGSKVEDEHESSVNMVMKDECSDDDDVAEDCLSGMDSKSPALCQHDSEAHLDSEYIETESNDQEANTEELDQCTTERSDSGHSSSYIASADDDDADTTPGILL